MIPVIANVALLLLILDNWSPRVYARWKARRRQAAGECDHYVVIGWERSVKGCPKRYGHVAAGDPVHQIMGIMTLP